MSRRPLSTGNSQRGREITQGPALDAGALSRRFFEAFSSRDLDPLVSMLAEDVCDEMSNLPVMGSPGAARDMSESLFGALGDAETKLLDCIAQSDEVTLTPGTARQ